MSDNTNRDDLTELLSKPERKVTLRVRELREARGWSQTDLANRAGFDQGWIGHIESGRRNPSLGNAVQLADTLGVSLDVLCGRSDARDVDGEWRRKIAALLG